MAVDVARELGKMVGNSFDVDGWYGAQCADLANYWSGITTGYNRICVIPTLCAADMFANADPTRFLKVRNTPDNYPDPGSIVVFDKSLGNGFGHIAVVESANDHLMNLVEQDGFAQEKGTYRIQRGYHGVIGWLVPKCDFTTETVTAGGPSPIFTWWDVDPGDTLSKIANESGVTVDWIVNRNGITNPDLIHVGDRIWLN